MIECKNISFSYGNTKVFEDFSYTFDKKTILCGNSGCGKTTLLRLILGLEKPCSGKVITDEVFSCAFSEPVLCEQMSAWDNVLMLPKVYKAFASDKKGFLSQMFDELLLDSDSVKNKPVSSLSKGMRQRISIVRGIFADSTVVILDEPMTGLEEKMAFVFLSFLEKYLYERGCIMVSHHPTILGNSPYLQLKLG